MPVGKAARTRSPLPSRAVACFKHDVLYSDLMRPRCFRVSQTILFLALPCADPTQICATSRHEDASIHASPRRRSASPVASGKSPGPATEHYPGAGLRTFTVPAAPPARRRQRFLNLSALSRRDVPWWQSVRPPGEVARPQGAGAAMARLDWGTITDSGSGAGIPRGSGTEIPWVGGMARLAGWMESRLSEPDRWPFENRDAVAAARLTTGPPRPERFERGWLSMIRPPAQGPAGRERQGR
jgi:hypothetical protein